MKKTLIFLVISFLIMCLLSACSDDKNDSPTWLEPYKGNYEGKYTGDDYGHWTLGVGNSTRLTLKANSDIYQESYSYNGEITQNEDVVFDQLSTQFIGKVMKAGVVTGTWNNPELYISGDFFGWRKPNSVNASYSAIITSDGDLYLTREFDDQGRETKTQYYWNGKEDYYGIRSYSDTEYSYQYYDEKGQLIYQYKNPLPLNEQGLSETATYIRNYDNSVRYDTINYEYDSEGHRTRYICRITIVDNDSQGITTGVENVTYSFVNGNRTEFLYYSKIGEEETAYTISYTYYTELPNKQNNLALYLGNLNANLLKSYYYTSSSNSYSKFYDYELYDNGKIKKATRYEEISTPDYQDYYSY